ncbi:hypothetical protein BV22DRAFT_1127029 [Leucogyrophana mollusca]|uniref:Uncharacterized protein n=1 Tax=Leucogyrophana mollusca TaxID=85980 RepID=A0ACB8BTB4_9AGAM|nr:hypothetical protein BV22DRAFT_1127029 [Leucogyrophana mollusca]
MGPIRNSRHVSRTVGSIIIEGSPNNRTRMGTTIGFACDKFRDAGDIDSPIDVTFEQFMRIMRDKAKIAGMPIGKRTEANMVDLLIEAAAKEHIEVEFAQQNGVTRVASIRILPQTRKKLNGFVAKLNGYGELDEKVKYRAALGLSSRHFKSRGRLPTKNETVSNLLTVLSPQARVASSQAVAGHRSIQVGPSLANIDAPAVATNGPDVTMAGPGEEEQEEPVVAEPLEESEVTAGQEAQSAQPSLAPATPAPSFLTRLVRSTFGFPYSTPESIPRRGPIHSVSSPPSSPSPVSRSPDSRLTSHLNDDANSSNATLGPLAALDAAYSGVRNIVQETYDENTRLSEEVDRYREKTDDLERQIGSIEAQLRTAEAANGVLREQCRFQRITAVLALTSGQQLQRENQDLRSENQDLRSENEKLRGDRASLQALIEEIRGKVADLQVGFSLAEGNLLARISTLEARNGVLTGQNAELRTKLHKLRESIPALAQLLDSLNNSVVPPADAL